MNDFDWKYEVLTDNGFEYEVSLADSFEEAKAEALAFIAEWKDRAECAASIYEKGGVSEEDYSTDPKKLIWSSELEEYAKRKAA